MDIETTCVQETVFIKLQDRINVSQFGQDNLDEFNEILKEIRKKDRLPIYVDMEGTVINNKLLLELARISIENNVEYINMSQSRLEVIQAYIQTYFFLKENLGREKYSAWLSQKIVETEYPYMILDNRLSESIFKSDFEIIKPIKFKKLKRSSNTVEAEENSYKETGDILLAKRIKSTYTNPKNLITALQNKQNIWESIEIHVTDFGEYTNGLRFASNIEEKEMLTLVESIIESIK